MERETFGLLQFVLSYQPRAHFCIDIDRLGWIEITEINHPFLLEINQFMHIFN